MPIYERDVRALGAAITAAEFVALIRKIRMRARSLYVEMFVKGDASGLFVSVKLHKCIHSLLDSGFDLLLAWFIDGGKRILFNIF